MGFRAIISLSKFFSDERSSCFIYLNDAKYKSIAHLEEYLRKLFKIKINFCLMISNCYLPSEEDIKIIQPGDNISVIPLSIAWSTSNKENESFEAEVETVQQEKIKKKKKKKAKQEVDNQIEEEIISPKKEINQKGSKDHEIESKDDKKLPDNPETNGLDKNNQSKDMSFSSECETDSEMIEDHSKDLLEQLKSKAFCLLGDLGSKQLPGVTGGRINKRKRTRKRSKKGLPMTIQSEVSESKPSSTNSYKPLSHIKFYDVDPVVQNAKLNCETKTKPRIISALTTTYNTLSLSNYSSSEISDGEKKISAKTSNGSKPTEIVINTSLQKNMSIDKKTSNEPDTIIDFATVNKSDINIDSLRTKLSQYPVMDAVFPVPKDLILFKTLKLDSYVPAVSDFILGFVLDVDKVNNVIKMSIIDGFSEISWLTDNLNSKENDDVWRVVDVPWSQVFEPRLVFP